MVATLVTADALAGLLPKSFSISSFAGSGMEMETARRNLGLVPTPVFDENHVNVMPIPPRKKGDNKPFPEEKKAEELVKQKRKRKPKNK